MIAGATQGLIGLLLVNSPNNNNGMADGLQAIADWDGGEVSCVSISYGLAEANWDRGGIKSTEAALKVGVLAWGACQRCGCQHACRACSAATKRPTQRLVRSTHAHTCPFESGRSCLHAKLVLP